MTDRHEKALARAHMVETIETLGLVLTAIVRQLPERAMLAVAGEARRHYEALQRQADETDNDARRKRAAAAHDVWARLDDAVAQRIDELADGSVVRTIQPAPIPPDERIAPGRDY